MSEDLKTKTICVVDNGLFVSFARKLAAGFKKVYYTTPWQSAFPRKREMSVGEGLPDIERVNRPLRLADEIDLWVFPDLYQSDLQLFLEARGARVWGAREGEQLELARWQLRDYLTNAGLPVAPAERIMGLEPLREHLRQVKGTHYVKGNYRGDMETWKHRRYELSEPRLNALEHELDVLKEDYEFIVESEIPNAVEIGYDGFTVDGRFPGYAMQAFEVKDLGMIGVTKAYADLAAPVRTVNAALSPALAEYRYRGFLSTEIRWTKDRKPYLIDPCCRMGTPSNELLQELFSGWPEALWEGAAGNLVDVKPVAKFGVLAMIHSEWSAKNWQAIHFPPAVAPWVKLRNQYGAGSRSLVVPQKAELAEVGAVVGVGNTLLEAIKHVKVNADQISGHTLNVNLESIDKALATIAEGEKFGIRFTDQALPTAEQLRRAVA